MQQISNLAGTQVATASAELLPFSFGMSLEEGQEFYDILQQTMTDLEQGNLDNDEIAKQLSFIKENIPEELMTKIEESLQLDKSKESKEDELSAKAFAVLNLIDNIIDNIDQVETTSQLESSMSQSGVSQSNIKTTIEMLDTSTQNTDISLDATQEKSIENSMLKQEQIAQFQANQKANTSFLSEKVLTGKELTTENTISTQPVATKEASIEESSLTKTTDTVKTADTQTTEQTQPGKTLAEMLNLFKKTKQEANAAGLNLDKADKSKITPETEKTANTTTKETSAADIIANKASSNTSQVQAQHTTQQETLFKQDSSKTNGAINKSEFKELTSKFTAEAAEEVNTGEVRTTEEFKPAKQTSATENNIHLAKNFNVNHTQKAATIDNIDIAEIEQLEQTNETHEVQEAKNLPSNFNMQLYKIAQQSNIQNQINVAIKNLKDQNMQQLKIKLNPEELGSITIDMELVDSAARGVISVERPEVAQQLAQNLKDIFANFKQAGFEVDVKDIVVKVDDQNQPKQQNQQEFTDENTKELEFTFSEDDLVDIKV